MNLLHSIFLERFWDKRYYDTTGRSYVEYISEKEKGYTWKICFFHFSQTQERKNSYMDIEILSFIKAYYSQAYQYIYPLLKYAIQHDIVVTFNSLTPYSFLIKFQNQNEEMNALVTWFIQKYTSSNFQLHSSWKIRFYELVISLKPQFCINEVKLYSESPEALDISPYYQDRYIEKDNVFMSLAIETTFFWGEWSIQKGVLIKLTRPFCFSSSPYLLSHFAPALQKHFDMDHIYLAFIEKTYGSENDSVYFTDGFLIPA